MQKASLMALKRNEVPITDDKFNEIVKHYDAHMDGARKLFEQVTRKVAAE